MSTLFHMRLDVRKVQDYIFQVPKLKFMLGANSKIGELFGATLPRLMEGSTSLFSAEQLSRIKDAKVRKQFGQNILSSSGGHFEALFDCGDKMKLFITDVSMQIAKSIPDLEYSISWREFNKDNTLSEFSKLKVNQVNSSCANTNWYDIPYYELCNQDGLSCATTVEDSDRKKENVGTKARLMNQQADRFYNLQTQDAIATFYHELKIPGDKLAKSLKELAECGKSLKDNMLAYIKIDGNGTGARFREMKESIENEYKVFDGFIKIEEFWAENRGKIWESLKLTLQGEAIIKHTGVIVPYLLLMLGGDDLFLVCIPEIALDIATDLAKNMGSEFPISTGIAYVKESYPIGLANHLAESCLESAKSGSYRDGATKPAYLDWHVHFDSVYQDMPDIRKKRLHASIRQ